MSLIFVWIQVGLSEGLDLKEDVVARPSVNDLAAVVLPVHRVQARRADDHREKGRVVAAELGALDIVVFQGCDGAADAEVKVAVRRRQ